jgi:hypothetical protein
MGINQSPAKQRAKKNKIIGYLISTLIITLFLMSGGYFLKHKINKQSYDKTTNCPESGVSQHSVILIDTTDNYNPTQKKSIRGKLLSVIENSQKDEKISVYTIDENYEKNLLPLQTKCNPGDASEINPFYENERMKKDYWEKHFFKPLESEFNNLLEKGESNHSPIMEMIQAISIATFQNQQTSVKKKLFIVSDMIQNTTEYSHYRGSLKFLKFKETQQFIKVRTDLKAVTVEILYMRRPGAEEIQKGKIHSYFWRDYFEDMGAVFKSIKMGEG